MNEQLFENSYNATLGFLYGELSEDEIFSLCYQNLINEEYMVESCKYILESDEMLDESKKHIAAGILLGLSLAHANADKAHAPENNQPNVQQQQHHHLDYLKQKLKDAGNAISSGLEQTKSGINNVYKQGVATYQGLDQSFQNKQQSLNTKGMEHNQHLKNVTIPQVNNSINQAKDYFNNKVVPKAKDLLHDVNNKYNESKKSVKDMYDEYRKNQELKKQKELEQQKALEAAEKERIKQQDIDDGHRYYRDYMNGN